MKITILWEAKDPAYLGGEQCVFDNVREGVPFSEQLSVGDHVLSIPLTNGDRFYVPLCNIRWIQVHAEDDSGAPRRVDPPPTKPS